MIQAYGCIEGIYPGGSLSGWARLGDSTEPPQVVAFVDEIELARGSCSFERADIGGQFGFHIECGERLTCFDLLSDRFRLVVRSASAADDVALGTSPTIKPTEDALHGCWTEVRKILAALPERSLADLKVSVTQETERRQTARLAAVGPGWRPLEVLRLAEVKRDPGTVVLDEEVAEWERPPAAFVLDLSCGTFASSVDTYRTFLLGKAVRHLRGVYETVRSNQLVYGSHHFYPFLGTNDTVQFQGLDDATFRLEYHIDHQNIHSDYGVPLIDRSDGGYRISYAAMSPDNVVELDGDIYFGSPVEPTNWGMWLIQGLQSAWRFKIHGERGRLLCFSSERFQRMLLAFVGITDDKIINMAQWRPYRCERLHALQYSHDTSLSVRPSDREVLHSLVLQASKTAGSATPARAIFVSRRNITARKAGTYRPLLNEDALLIAMERLGLVIVEPELLPFDQQIALFSEAELVVGLGGAGLFNVVFCRPGTRVITIESSTAFIENHATLFASLGLQYGVVFGQRDLSDPSEIHYRWTVDIAPVVEQVRDWLPRPRGS